MKPVSVAPSSGQVEETVTRKRIVPAEPAGRGGIPEFWAYFEAIKMDDWSPYRHKLFIYRYQGDAPTGTSDQMEKNETGVMTLPDGEHVPLTNQEDTEYAITKKFGGGLFRLILKRGSERVTQVHVHTEGPRRTIQSSYRGDRAESEGPQVTGMSDATAEVAHHAINTIANQERTAVDVGIKALLSAGEVVERFSKGPAAAGTPNPVMDRILDILITRALAPPPDPLDMLTKLLTITSQMSGGGGGPMNPILSKVMDSAVEKLLNPPASGPSSSTGAELVRALPQLGGYVAQSLAEWRAGSEAQRDTAAIMRGSPAVPGARPVQPPAGVLAAPPANNPTLEDSMGAPSLEFIESRIVKIFREGETADEAAHETLEFLETMNPALVTQLQALGEPGLMQTFNSRPQLKPATQNIPLLTEFIRSFLKYANEAHPKPN